MNLELLSKISELYNLPNLQLVKRVEEGVLSNNYIVESQGQNYFLKHHRHADPRLIKKIHLVEKFFSDKGFLVVLSLPSQNGDLFIDIENQFYSVLPFVIGKTLVRGSIAEKHVTELGKMLGQLHLAGKVEGNIFDIPEFKVKQLGYFPEFILKMKKFFTEKDNLNDFDLMAKEYLELQEQLSKELQITESDINLPNDHLVHGDFHESNVLFDEDDNIIALFDFEKTMMAPRSAELARSIRNICFNGKYDGESFELVELFLKEYQKVYPINHEELSKALRCDFEHKVYANWILDEVYLKNNPRPASFLAPTLLNVQYLSGHRAEYESKILSYLN